MFIKNKKGFTLIELLVVIGILGILAIGLLAAIDPFEQLKKGRDTNLRNVTVEYVNATTRYYATHGVMPWPEGSEPAESALNSTEMIAYTALLVAEGELKEKFQEALGANAGLILVTGNAEPLQAIVCFDPDSKSLSADATTIYNPDGTDNSIGGGGVCPAVAEACYWCAR